MNPVEQVEILRAACCVAGLGHKIKPAEAKIVDRLAKHVGVGKASLDAMIERSEEDSSWHEDQFRVLKTAPQESMSVLFQVALADGELEDEEIVVLRQLATKLGVSDEVFEQLVAKARDLLAAKRDGSESAE